MTDRTPQSAPSRPNPHDEDDELRVSPLDAADGRPRPRLPAALAGPALRRLWRLSGVVAGVTLAVILIVTLAPHLPRPAPSRPAPIPYTALRVSPDVARCMTGFSWSHDGRQIAALTSYDCASANSGVNAPVSKLYLFNAATGASTATIDMEAPLDLALRRIGIDMAATDQYGVSFYASAWSPDDHLLATQFVVYGSRVAVEGVAVATLGGAQAGHVAVLLNTPIGEGQPSPLRQASDFALAPTERWDLTTGAVSTVYLQPALTYRWLSDGALVATEPLGVSVEAPAPSDMGAPTGDPIGGEAFSLWRTGYVALINATDCDPNPSSIAPLPAPYAEISLGSVAWSPDGRYLLDVNVNARLLATFARTHAQSVAQLKRCAIGPPPEQMPAAALHDKGLAVAVKRLDPAGSQELSLAWSPDGRRLAALTLSLDHAVGTAALYDCASGTQTHAFTISQFYNPDDFTGSDPTSGFVQTPVWSPDSSHLLLLLDGVTPQVIVLGPRALGG